LKCTVKQLRVTINFGKGLVQEKFGGNGWLAHGRELGFEEAHRVSKGFVDIYANKLGRGHFREIAKAAYDRIQISQFRL